MLNPNDDRPDPVRLTKEIEALLQRLSNQFGEPESQEAADRRHHLGDINHSLWIAAARRELVNPLFAREFTPRRRVPFLFARLLDPIEAPMEGVETRWAVRNPYLGYGLAGVLAQVIDRQAHEGWNAPEQASARVSADTPGQYCWHVERPLDPAAPVIKLTLYEANGLLCVDEIAVLAYTQEIS